MRVSVGKHIERLQERLERLNREVMRNHLTRQQRNQVEAEIRAATVALAHFHALPAEEKLSSRVAG